MTTRRASQKSAEFCRQAILDALTQKTMVSGFQSLSEALKQVYPTKSLEDMINKQSPFREAFQRDPVEEALPIQIAALLGEPIDAKEIMWGAPDAIEWMADLLERKQMNRKRLEAWRSGTLDLDAEKRAKHRRTHPRPVRPREADDSSAKRTPLQAQLPRRRPRGRARSSA